MIVQIAQQNVSAHGMGKRERRPVVHMAHDLIHEGAQIFRVLREVDDVGLARILKRTGRTALTAPVECGNGKTAPAQFVEHLEIFFEKFGMALQHKTNAAKGDAFRGVP